MSPSWRTFSCCTKPEFQIHPPSLSSFFLALLPQLLKQQWRPPLTSLPFFSVYSNPLIHQQSSFIFSKPIKTPNLSACLPISSFHNEIPYLPLLQISIYTGRCANNTYGLNSRKRLLGRVVVPLDLSGSETRACVFHNCWISVGKKAAQKGSSSSTAEFHLNVKTDLDPRFVFQLDGEPECSPQVFQIQGNIRQPVFTCKFSFRTPGDRNQRSRSFKLESSTGSKWRSPFGSEKHRPIKEQKGWSITVHDLSGSPVAAASMVTPFVPSPGSDRVSRSNPGSWLILRPGDGAWEPWARLEAWRGRGASDGLGYRLELIPDTSAAAGIVLAESFDFEYGPNRLDS